MLWAPSLRRGRDEVAEEERARLTREEWPIRSVKRSHNNVLAEPSDSSKYQQGYEENDHALGSSHCWDLTEHLTLRLTAARRPGCETKLLYPDHRPSLDLPEADGAAVAVEPVVRPYFEQADSSGEASRTRYRPRSLPICTRQLCRQ